MAKASALAVRADGYHVADLDLSLHDPVDEQFHHSAALREVGAGQTILEATAERLGRSRPVGQLRLSVDLAFQLLGLRRESLRVLLRHATAALVFRQRDDPL
ncbi:hypothetical protein FF100_30195 [Methylobacterium terricola]|uniref:Uncharacterized protein n=1 Tax=Methylobacterium terricola TaxID=2583531 RepID=A0A5C4L8W5_9HYPH|nr:hypothetical protein [Methylobacterium terricola]TNC08182.1 hypothetical protein FF100_30195 [Methylobacterium terricola]